MIQDSRETNITSGMGIGLLLILDHSIQNPNSGKSVTCFQFIRYHRFLHKKTQIYIDPILCSLKSFFSPYLRLPKQAQSYIFMNLGPQMPQIISGPSIPPFLVQKPGMFVFFFWESDSYEWSSVTVKNDYFSVSIV